MMQLLQVMFLAAALNSLRIFETNVDRQKKLAETLKNPEKLAKVEIRIEFLTAYRKNDLTPRFIEDAVHPVRRIFRNNKKVITRSDNFAKVLLNVAISASFRAKAFLVRQRARPLEALTSFLTKDRYRHIYSTCARIYDITIHENRPRLVKKFHSLKTKIQPKICDNDDIDPVTIQRRVKNLSSAELDAPGLALLAKGPNFATTQTVSKTVLLQVEKGVERFSYAKRWRDKMSKCHGNIPSSDATGVEPLPAEGTRTPPEDVTSPQRPTIKRSSAPSSVRGQTTTDVDAAQRGVGEDAAERRVKTTQGGVPAERGTERPSTIQAGQVTVTTAAKIVYRGTVLQIYPSDSQT